VGPIEQKVGEALKRPALKLKVRHEDAGIKPSRDASRPIVELLENGLR
jgi:hypothetical protein